MRLGSVLFDVIFNWMGWFGLSLEETLFYFLYEVQKKPDHYIYGHILDVIYKYLVLKFGLDCLV